MGWLDHKEKGWGRAQQRHRLPFLPHPCPRPSADGRMGSAAQTTLRRHCRASVPCDASLPQDSLSYPGLLRAQLAGLSCEAVTDLVKHCLLFAFPPSLPHYLHFCYFGVLPPRKGIWSQTLPWVLFQETWQLLQSPFYWSPCFCSITSSLFSTQWSAWSFRNISQKSLLWLKLLRGVSFHSVKAWVLNPQASLIWSQPRSLCPHPLRLSPLTPFQACPPAESVWAALTEY